MTFTNDIALDPYALLSSLAAVFPIYFLEAMILVNYISPSFFWSAIQEAGESVVLGGMSFPSWDTPGKGFSLGELPFIMENALVISHRISLSFLARDLRGFFLAFHCQNLEGILR